MAEVHLTIDSLPLIGSKCGLVAQSVEQRPEKACVGSSILSRATTLKFRRHSSFFLFGVFLIRTSLTQPVIALFLAVYPLLAATANAADQTIFELGSASEPDVRMSIDQAEVASRYQIVTDQNGNAINKDIQDRVLLGVKVSFFNNRVRIEMQSLSGGTFAAAFNRTGMITGEGRFDFNIRRLFLTAVPLQGVEVSLGSLGPEFGAGSENSNLDNDGYIVGYRARVEIKDGSIVVTTGYLGDFQNPNAFDRFHRLDELNYVQALVNYQLMQYVRASLEFDRVGSANYVRPALTIGISQWTQFADSLMVEALFPLHDGQDAKAVSAGISKRVKDVFGSLLPNRELLISANYQFARLQAALPFGDHVFLGNSMRFQVRLAKLFSFPGGDLDSFIDYVQSLDTTKRHRLELGLALKLN